MAASGYTPISLYYSTTASAVPTAGNLANGELALNIADMKLYAKNSAGAVTLLASNASTTGVDSLSFGSTGLTPSTATTGAITVAGTLNVANGGTGQTSFTANGVLYASGTGTLANGSALTFDGSLFSSTTKSKFVAVEIGVSEDFTTNLYYSGGWKYRATGYGTVIGASSGAITFSNTASSGSADASATVSEQMRLTSTGLGIGTSSPAYKLHVANYMGLGTQSSTGAGAGISMIPSSTLTNWFVGANYVNSGAFEIIPSTAGGGSTFSTPALTISSAGNLGLGVTPSAWNSSFKALEIVAKGNAILSYTGGGTIISSNAYFDSVGWKYGSNGFATNYDGSAGKHIWYNAPSGTAGNAISFTQAMTLDASGNLVVAVGNIFTASTSGIFFAGAGSFTNGIYGVGTNNVAIAAGGSERGRFSSTGGFSVGTTADPGAGAIYATGAITAYYSDERLKDVKGRIQNALAKVRRLSGVYYTNNETAKALGYTSDEMQVGVLANQMKGELPEIVKPAPFDLDENGNSKSGQNYMTVQYERGLPLIIEAIKELADTVDALAAR